MTLLMVLFSVVFLFLPQFTFTSFVWFFFSKLVFSSIHVFTFQNNNLYGFFCSSKCMRGEREKEEKIIGKY